MTPSPRKLALLGLAAAGLPLVVAGALAALGPELRPVVPLEDALRVALALAGGIVAVLWPLVALAPGTREDGLRGRALELLVLGAAFAPALRLAALLSRASDDGAARAFVALAVLLVAQGAALAGLGRTRLPRAVAVSFFATLALAGPLAGAFFEDAFGTDAGLARGSIPAALLERLDGGEAPWALAAALALVGLSGAALRGRALVVLALAAAPALADDLPLQLEQGPSFLLGPRCRVGEPAPLRVRVRALSKGFDGELGARSGGLLVSVPIHLAPGRSEDVALAAIADSAGTPLLEVRGEKAFPLGTPDWLNVVPPSALFVGIEAGTRSDVASVLDTRRDFVEVTHVPRGLEDLAPLGGGALDVLAVGRGANPELASFAACGGTLVLPDAASLDAFAGAGARRTENGLARVPLGAGSLVAPATSGSVAALWSALGTSPRRALAPFALDLEKKNAEPSASARTAGRIALLGGLLVLVGALLAPTSEPRRIAAFLLVSIALTAYFPRLVLGRARAPVFLDGETLLEAPSGGTLAGATEVLRFGSPRRIVAEVALGPAPPLQAVFASEQDAARSRAELRLETEPATIAPSAAHLRFPLAPGAPMTFARRSPRDLGGSVSVSREAVTNGLPVPIEDAILVVEGQVLEVGALAAGETRRVAGSGVVLEGYMRRLRADPSLAARQRATLLATALRGNAMAVRLAGFLPGHERRSTSGVLEEAPGATLLVVAER